MQTSLSIRKPTRKATIMDFPTELIDAICQSVTIATPSYPSPLYSTDHATLRALALTSQIFLHSAQRALFGRIAALITAGPSSEAGISHSSSTTLNKRSATQQQSGLNLLRTLRRNPRLAAYVRTFECRVDDLAILEERLEGLGDLLHDVLANTVGLLELALFLPERLPCGFLLSQEISAAHPMPLGTAHGKKHAAVVISESGSHCSDSHSSPHSIESQAGFRRAHQAPLATSYLLTAAHPELLYSLSLSFSLDENVVGFLARAYRLRHLELAPRTGRISTLDGHVDLRDPFLPMLTSFCGSLGDASTLLPRRMDTMTEIYIRRLEGEGDEQIAEEADALERLFGSAAFHEEGTLEILELHTIIPPLSALPILALFSRTRSVRAIRLVAGTPLTSGRAPGLDFYQSIASHLTSFPNLTAFELCGTHWPCSPSPNPLNSMLNQPTTWDDRLPVMSSHATSDDGQAIFSPPSPIPNSTPLLAPSLLAPSLAEEWEDMFGVAVDDGFVLPDAVGPLEFGFGDALFLD